MDEEYDELEGVSERKSSSLSSKENWRDYIGENAILWSLPSVERTIVRRRKALLSSLAHFIGKDFDVPVTLGSPGEGWSGDFRNNRIVADPKDLASETMDALRYRVANQAGKRRISRHEDISPEQWQAIGYQFLTHTLETARANNFVAESYPKFSGKMSEALKQDEKSYEKNTQRAKEKVGFTPRFIEA